MVELKHFSKSYGKKTAVSDVSMRCVEGTVTGIIGLNGAGKTTILKAICARHFATAGSVCVNGFDAEGDTEKVRALTGFVEETPNMPDELLVSEFIMMCAGLRGAGNDSAMNAAERCSLAEFWNEKIGRLSKGQRERVNFAQALVNDPPVLVLDEPASGLDPAQIVRMRELVRSLKKGRTIILSTHLMQEVDALCDTVFVMNAGRLAESGSADEIIARTGTRTLEDAFFKLTSR
ncbi:MAG: ABC transporter ATP-binding protein [Treponema sp.]|uniref:ABC transporter ATP-binding protein n=1 Tax=Treponema sp. TaxID=166 RepID=UPI002580395E|nr:ABC transporter ATP-binding protein [Treponema sp.]MBQ5537154.1 ABC transporter ATP-binding protein [Treponema sp.]